MFKGKRVFLAAPYSQWMDEDMIALLPERKSEIELVRQCLLSHGAAVFNAHYNEDWGRSWLSADVCTPLDHAAVTQSDVILAFIGDPPSGGVYVELGWSSALGKPILVVAGNGVPLSPMLKGLSKVTSVDIMEHPTEIGEDFLEEVVSRLAVLLVADPGAARVAVLPHFASLESEAEGGPDEKRQIS